MTLDPDVVRIRVSEIEESVARLERFAGLSVDEFTSNQDALDIACYRLLLAIEASLALCYHVAARRFRRAPEDYAGCFGTLAEHGLLPVDLTERLRRMARFRNLLVHMYWKIDYRRVHEIIQHDLEDLRTFTAAIVAILPPAGERQEPE